MTRRDFEAARRHMLAMLRDWVNRGADLAEVEEETKATASAMRQIAQLRIKARQGA